MESRHDIIQLPHLFDLVHASVVVEESCNKIGSSYARWESILGLVGHLNSSWEISCIHLTANHERDPSKNGIVIFSLHISCIWPFLGLGIICKAP